MDLYVETDVSGKSIGMALLQSNSNERDSLYPIACGSKILTAVERSGGCAGKIPLLYFGCPVITLTDHKPLIAISKKALVNAPPRLQRLLLRLNNYNATLQWISGKEMVFADHLSRNIANRDSNELTCKGLDLKIEDVYLSASEDRCLSLTKETDKDETLVALKNIVINQVAK